jgi:hypothetical protein
MNELVAGDLDGDGVLEFVVGYNGVAGVHLFDAAGERRWRLADGNVWHIERPSADWGRRLGERRDTEMR